MKTKKYLVVVTIFIAIGCFTSQNFFIIPVFAFNTPKFFYIEKFYRTELYFGMDKPDGTVVTAEDWAQFLEDEVTVRFPEGFTVLESLGQYRDKSGKIVKENSKVLVLLYTGKTRRQNNQKIEEIRTLYKKKFLQESILRLDFRQTVEVSF